MHTSPKDVNRSITSLQLESVDHMIINQSWFAKRKLTIVFAFNDGVNPADIFDDYIRESICKHRRSLGEILVIGEEQYKSCFDGIRATFVSDQRHKIFRMLGFEQEHVNSKVMIVHESGEVIKSMSFDGFTTDAIWYEVVAMLDLFLD